MTLQGVRRVLWMNKLLSLPIHNVPNAIQEAFQYGLHNSSQRTSKNLLDWYGNPIPESTLHDAIDFTLPWKFLLNRNEPLSAAYSLMAEFTYLFSIHLNRNNQTVLPTVNFSDWNTLPPRLGLRRISWHSRGRDEDSLHLKIGSYPRHVSIDRYGYSGWASFAGSKDYLNEDLDHLRKNFKV
jgi:hypothetical protein